MSDLNSIFDVLYGWPNSSALSHDFPPKTGQTSPAGTIVSLGTMQLRAAVVLKIVDDSLITAPTLGAGDAGKAYQVAGAGGVWSVFAIGDVVEWSGTAWKLIVAATTGAVPVGTRVVAIGASAAGSFVGGEEKIWVWVGGKTPAWTADPAPTNGALIDISGVNSIYYAKRFQYVGTHPAGAWAQADDPGGVAIGYMQQAAAVAVANPKPSYWIVIEGNDQFDGEFVPSLTCLKINTGLVFKVKCAVANSLVPGEFVEPAGGGLLAKCTGTNHAIGQVQWSNGVAGAGGIIIATGV